MQIINTPSESTLYTVYLSCASAVWEFVKSYELYDIFFLFQYKRKEF